MSSSSSSKGTRKTYSFEEREILITLINKHEDVEDKKSDPTSMCKRKSAWSKLADEYNLLVGPHAVRSPVQLRRCWENMKACKRNREEKRTGPSQKNLSRMSNDRKLRLSLGNWQKLDLNPGQNSLDNSGSTNTIGLPPNVVFEPKLSEPFTLQSVSSKHEISKLAMQKKNVIERDEYDDVEDMKIKESTDDTFEQTNVPSDFSQTKIELPPSIGTMGDCPDKFMTDQESSIEDNHSEREDIECGADLNNPLNYSSKTNATQTTPSPIIFPNNYSSTNNNHKHNNHYHRRHHGTGIYKVDELHALALSEAQLKVDIALMQKEEAKVKLEEVKFRKEEARLRMLFFTYKLDRLKEVD